MTHVSETGAGKMESIYGAGFWTVCHVYKAREWTSVPYGILDFFWSRNGCFGAFWLTVKLKKFGYEEATKKLSYCCDSRSHCVYMKCGILANYQTDFGYQFTNGWYARSDSTGRVYERTQTESTQAWLAKVFCLPEISCLFTRFCCRVYRFRDNAQRHRQTDGQTNGSIMSIDNHTACISTVG